MKRPRQKSAAELAEQVRLFNENCPVGTEVFYHPVIGRPESCRTKVTARAFVLSGHTACCVVARVPGINGGVVALDALEVA